MLLERLSLKILVTGGAGYIGSHTCKLLRRAGHEPVVYDNLSTGHRYLIRDNPFIQGDIGDAEAMRRALVETAPDAVIHFAASAYVGESTRLPLAYYRNNVAGTLTLLEAMATVGVRKLVFSSSCATYGTPDALPIREDTRQRPINPYGETKLIGEWMMRAAAHSSGLASIALRYFNASGADPDGELGELHDPETHLIPLALAAARGSGSSLTVFGTDYPTADGTCERDYLHVTDLAQAHVLALDALGEEGAFAAYNLGTGTGYSVARIIAAVEQVTGQRVPHVLAPRRAGDPAVLVADAAKARRELDWTPAYSDLDTILQTAWRWTNAPHNPFNT